MPNEPEKSGSMPPGKPTLHTTQLPIDLGNKVIVKPANDNSKMSIQPTFRTINQQPTPQMRVVRMPGNAGTTQIIQTHVVSNQPTILKPTMPGRSTITVSKSPTTAYLPRVTTLNTIQSAKGTQIRTPTPPTSVSGISPAFVRSTITPRTSSPSTVLTQGQTAWVSNSGAVQVQVPQQIIRPSLTSNRTITANIFQQQANQQNSTISVSTTATGTSSSGQQTYVATVLPQRTPQGATIVYTSQPQQPFIQGQVQRMSLGTATSTARQIRPIQRISTAGIRVNTSSLSIRPNVPGLAPTTVLATPPRNTSSGLASSTTISNTIPARIFQVQSPQTQGGQQVISQSNQKILSANVMLPIIVNSKHITHPKNSMQPGIIAHVSKLGAQSNEGGTIISTSMSSTMPSMSSSMVATIQSTQANSAHQQSGTHQTIYTSQSSSQQQSGGGQIITVSQQPQMISNQGQHQQQSGMQNVVPLTLGSRAANIKTITVSTSNAGGGGMDHRNLSSNQATTIMPITKIISQSTHQNIVTTQSQNPPSTSTLYYEPNLHSNSSNADHNKAMSSSLEQSFSSSGNFRYSDKMIHSIIQNSLQNNSGGNSGTSTIRFSPAVVENQIATATSAGQQQLIGSIVQSPSIDPAVASHMIVPIQPASPRGNLPSGSNTVLRKLSETTPTKAVKKQAKTKGFQAEPNAMHQQQQQQQAKVTQQRPLSAAVAQLTQNIKPLEARQQQQQHHHSTASSPKTTFSERESSPHDEFSDGSTTVSVPGSPRSDEDDLDEEILAAAKVVDDLKFFVKSPAKAVASLKREAPDNRDSQQQQPTPRKKAKNEMNQRPADVNNENNVDIANSKSKKDVVLKKPQASLLQTYNQSWKIANNHFMKYSDVRVRDDFRKPGVMDLANQPKIVQRADGWKTHMIGSEIHEMVKDEESEVERLNNILKQLETNETTPDVDKISELIKASMQRSRLLIDSFNDSKAQLLKIFDHKTHALDIINRCASKRNFKKR